MTFCQNLQELRTKLICLEIQQQLDIINIFKKCKMFKKQGKTYTLKDLHQFNTH